MTEPEKFPLSGSAAEEALDSMPDFDDDDDNDEDLDEDDLPEEADDEPEARPEARMAPPTVRTVPVPIIVQEPRRNAPRKTQPVPRVPKASLERQAQNQAEFEDFQSGLSFGQDQHRIIVSRLDPTHHPVTGANVGGILQTFYHRITEDDLQKEFGGGLFEIRIMGPNPATGKGLVLRKKDQIRIFGEPRSPKSLAAPQAQEDSALVKMLEMKDRESQRAHQEAREAQKALLEAMNKPQDNGMLQAVLTLVKETQNKSDQSIQSLMIQMREERLAEERRREVERKEEAQRRDEERRREEDRRREERADLLRRQDQEEKRWREEQESKKQQHEKEMMMLQERLKTEAQQQSKSAEMMMTFLERQREADKSRADEEKRTRENLSKSQMEMAQIGAKQNIELLMESSKFQMSMLKEALVDAKSTKNGGISEVARDLMAFKDLQRALVGEEDEGDKTSSAERIMDKVLPALSSVAGGFLASRGGAMGNPGVPPQRQLPPQPQTVAYVDQGPMEDGEEYEEDEPAPQYAPQHAPHAPHAAPPSQQVAQDMPRIDNDFKDFVFPPSGSSNEVIVSSLIKDLDLAVQKDMSPEEIADNVLAKFAEDHPLVAMLLKGASADELVKFIDEKVPKHWAIASPKGESMIRELHEIAKSG